MNDAELMQYYKERLDNELKAGKGSDCKDIQGNKAIIRFHIWKLVKQYNDLEKQEVKTKWHWWWNYNLTKRVLRKFKIKNIYRSKKAREYFLKLYKNKTCKMALHPLESWGKEEMIGFLYQMMEQDLPNRYAYLTVINKIKQL